GDYDDARWLAAEEIEQLWMPPALREPLVRIMRGEDVEPGVEWADEPAGGEGVPLAERASDEPATGEAVALAERASDVAAATDEGEESAPDNRAGWDAIAAAYQDERFGERYGEKLMWSYLSSEDDVHVLDDVRGRRAIVLGCGGGQDVVALERMGARAVGVDHSGAQIAYAKKFAARHNAENASFVEASIDDLLRFDDESFDLAVSSH